MKPFYIYLHCKPNGTPFYVGKGSGKRAYKFYPKSRQNKWHEHVVNKYGKENIIVEILCYVWDEVEAFRLEEVCIFVLRHLGYKLVNLTDGGGGVFNPTSEIRAKMASCGMLGKKQSDYQKEVVRITHTNKIVSEDTKNKIRIKSFGRPSGFRDKQHTTKAKDILRLKAIDRKHTEVSKLKMSKSRKGVPSPIKGRKIGPHKNRRSK